MTLTNRSLFLDTLHGPRTADIDHRHVGDLGNITTDENGMVYIDIRDSIIQLYNDTQSIANRTIVVHLHRDDGGEGGFPDSTTTGYDFVFHYKFYFVFLFVEIETLVPGYFVVLFSHRMH